MRFFNNIRRFIGRAIDTTKAFGRRFTRVDNTTKTDLPPQVSNNLARFGDLVVSNVRICRVPIQGAINSIFNFLTGGKWDSIKKQVGYDTLFHLYMLFDVGTTTLVLEKNQVVRLSEYPPTGKGECKNINFPSVNLNTMIKNTINKMGMGDFLRYDPFSRNCQDFILNVLQANGASTPELQNFILQPVDEIVKKLPGFVAPIAKGLTDIAGYIDTRLQNSVNSIDGRQEENASNNQADAS